jgi:hypothetical protein
LFWESESEKRREVRTDEKAHFVVDRGADVGAVDVVWGCGVRQAGTKLRTRANHNTPGELNEFAGSVLSPRLPQL